jgi:hypothetical protein
MPAKLRETSAAEARMDNRMVVFMCSSLECASVVLNCQRAKLSACRHCAKQ